MKIEANFKEDKKWQSVVAQAIEIGLTKAGIFTQNEARSRVAVDTGNLKNSIDYEVGKNETIVFSPVEYGIYQEYGTVVMTAHPFMRPALFSNRDKITAIIAKELKNKL